MTSPLDRAMQAARDCSVAYGTDTEDEEAFATSAVAAWKALQAGVSAKALSESIKQEIASGHPSKRKPTYTSPTSVLYHARTGHILLKAGTTALRPSEIQTLVRHATDGVGAGHVKRILKESKTKRDAVLGLQEALEARTRKAAGRTPLTAALLAAGQALEDGAQPVPNDLMNARLLVIRLSSALGAADGH